MNNQPTIEAFNSFYRQGMELYKAGQLSDARAALLKAAELANKISVGSTSYEVRMEYHNAAVKLLDFAKNDTPAGRYDHQRKRKVLRNQKFRRCKGSDRQGRLVSNQIFLSKQERALCLPKKFGDTRGACGI